MAAIFAEFLLVFHSRGPFVAPLAGVLCQAIKWKPVGRFGEKLEISSGVLNNGNSGYRLKCMRAKLNFLEIAFMACAQTNKKTRLLRRSSCLWPRLVLRHRKYDGSINGSERDIFVERRTGQ